MLLAAGFRGETGRGNAEAVSGLWFLSVQTHFHRVDLAFAHFDQDIRIQQRALSRRLDAGGGPDGHSGGRGAPSEHENEAFADRLDSSRRAGLRRFHRGHARHWPRRRPPWRLRQRCSGSSPDPARARRRHSCRRRSLKRANSWHKVSSVGWTCVPRERQPIISTVSRSEQQDETESRGHDFPPGSRAMLPKGSQRPLELIGQWPPRSPATGQCGDGRRRKRWACKPPGGSATPRPSGSRSATRLYQVQAVSATVDLVGGHGTADAG